MFHLSIFHYVIALAVITGFIRYKNLNGVLKTLPFFLVLTLFVEIATPLKLIRFHGNNAWFFNLFTTLEFLYYSFVFYCILKTNKIIPFVATIFLIFAIINIFFMQGFY